MSGSEYAGLVSRVAALLIDALVVTLVVLGVAGLPPLTWESLAPTSAPSWLAGACSIAALAVPWMYFTGAWWLTGQTIGDLLTGIVVEHRDGHDLSLPHAGLRAALGLLLAPLWLIGLLAVLSDGRRRAWHDQLLRTDVRYAAKH